MTTASSFTARTAAAARAAHLIVDQLPVIFADTLAARLLGQEADELIAYHRAHGSHVVLAGARGQATCRSRYTEDALAASVEAGTTQYVILGAGLDSSAYRPGLCRRLRIFEVDQQVTQDDKRARLAAAAIPEPDNVVLVPVDFESASLTAELARAGLDLAKPAFVSWLGVTMYLTAEAIARTLGELGTLANGSEVVADYMLPAELRDDAGAAYVELVAPLSADRGEPWLTFLSPQQMSDLLLRHGLTPIRHVGQRDIGGTRTWNRSDALRPVRLSLIGHAAAGLSRGRPVRPPSRGAACYRTRQRT